MGDLSTSGTYIKLKELEMNELKEKTSFVFMIDQILNIKKISVNKIEKFMPYLDKKKEKNTILCPSEFKLKGNDC